MAKKIKLTLVDLTPNEPTAPPSSLGKAGASLWRSVMTEFEIEDLASVEMLLQACSAVDRIAEYSAAIESRWSSDPHEERRTRASIAQS